MKLYIPEINDSIRLVEPWTFDLFNEYRNETLMEISSIEFPRIQSSFKQFVPFTIPTGEVLKIDRIYIRKGASDYSSLSFLWVGKRTSSKVITRTATAVGYGTKQSWDYDVKKPAKPVRFWAKLADVNNIEFEKV